MASSKAYFDLSKAAIDLDALNKKSTRVDDACKTVSQMHAIRLCLVYRIYLRFTFSTTRNEQPRSLFPHLSRTHPYRPACFK